MPNEPSDHLTFNGVHAATLDVTKDDSVQRLGNLINAQFDGRLDVLVNCA
jgi:NAD(P)-dependent dehydrogenase (short-subunit alcohol dehydrogenase family)